MADSQHTQDIIPRHQWTHDGTRVLVLRCGAVGYGGFEWPTVVGAKLRVATPTRAAECDHGGFYGWPWGFGIGDGKDPDWRALWIVFAAEPEDVVPVGNKVKCCGEVEIVFVGDWGSALAYVLPGQMAWVAHAASGAASATGEYGAASATGECGAASATGGIGAASTTGVSGAASATGWSGAAAATGWRGAAAATSWRGAASATGWSGAAAATGEYGAASATGVSGAASATGWRGVASATGVSGAAAATSWRGAASATGEYGAASATGEYGAASATGECGAASATGGIGAASATGACSVASVTGLHGRARGGPYSVIALAWWNDRDRRAEMRCARIGCGDGTDGTLKAGVWYCLNDQGDFVESA